MTDKLILLDIGGTFVKCSDGREIYIESNGSRESIIASFKEAVGDYTRVSAAVPGPFEYKSGFFRMEHKFAAVYGENFADLVGLPRENCTYIHDVNCMLLGEMCEGAAKDYDNVALVSFGTGLGFAMCKGRVIQTNELGSPATSIFKLPYGDGILEDYASKRGFKNGYKKRFPEAPDGLSVKNIADRAIAGDRAAIDTFLSSGDIVARAIAPILEENKIECLLFGGQISRSFKLFEPTVIKGLESVSCLKHISAISDFDNATFNGLKHNI